MMTDDGKLTDLLDSKLIMIYFLPNTQIKNP